MKTKNSSHDDWNLGRLPTFRVSLQRSGVNCLPCENLANSKKRTGEEDVTLADFLEVMTVNDGQMGKSSS